MDLAAGWKAPGIRPPVHPGQSGHNRRRVGSVQLTRCRRSGFRAGACRVCQTTISPDVDEAMRELATVPIRKQ